MKYIDDKELKKLTGRRLAATETFTFDCFPGIPCFNRCCRNLNLFLYPYDVIRLKNRLGISSDRFIDRYVSVVLRAGAFFPDVLLRMQDDNDSLCPFVTPEGCAVYADRPDTCRKFPMEEGVWYGADPGKTERIYFFKPPDFCQGPQESRNRTPAEWARGTDDVLYDKLTLEWAELKALFQNDPWGREGPGGPKAKMAFMALYNIDRFREFVFNSSFLKRYKVKTTLLKKMETEDPALLRFGFSWVRFFVWGQKTGQLRPR
ncbi:MAG: YkgJ family cysteine cluster protein [Desulfobacterales bacterium]|nr:YkgJ family cysteine cluster protein [Desulfobacterales bacterium]